MKRKSKIEVMVHINTTYILKVEASSPDYAKIKVEKMDPLLIMKKENLVGANIEYVEV